MYDVLHVIYLWSCYFIILYILQLIPYCEPVISFMLFDKQINMCKPKEREWQSTDKSRITLTVPSIHTHIPLSISVCPLSFPSFSCTLYLPSPSWPPYMYFLNLPFHIAQMICLRPALLSTLTSWFVCALVWIICEF